MRYTNHKNKYLKIVAGCLIAILALSNVPVSKVSAVENYFTARGSTLILNELGPDDDRVVTVTIKAAREMDLSSIEGYFTPVDEDDEELELNPHTGIKPYGMSVYCARGDDGFFGWNTEDCHSEYSGYEDDIHLQAGDPIFEATYTVKPDVLLARRSLPVTINAAVVKDGGEKTVSDIALDTEVFVYPAEDYRTISVYKEGNGSIVAPAVTLPDEEIEIGVIPDENNELVYFEINGQSMTDQVENNMIRVTMTESLSIVAYFQPVYTVTEGDGGEYVQGSGETLSFTIDADLSDFDGQGLIMIDDDNFDMRRIIVDAENSRLTFPADYLATLSLGEHKLEAIFPYPERGVARASFIIVEQQPEIEAEEEEGSLAVPNTGALTDKSADVGVSGAIAPTVVISIILMTGFLLFKRAKNPKGAE